MRVVTVLMLALLGVLSTAAPLFAQGTTTNYPGLGAGIGMGLAIVGIGIGIGLVGYAALSGIARQPEQAGAIQGAMFILAGLVEGAGIIALVLCLLLPLIV
ncbi:MAG: ATP synthase F0 subunit C [Thermogemmata sp.]|jgi:ATP synthase F0 subunit c|nr:ATP synthase F0 subunit C [Gemmataceae bacterium]